MEKEQLALTTDEQNTELAEIRRNTFYSKLDIEPKIFLQSKEVSIKARTVQTIIDNGKDFLEVKEKVGHGNFKEWLHSCFDMSYQTALNCMQVAERAKNTNFVFLKFLPKASLYLLCAPSIPDSAIQEAEDRYNSGEHISTKLAKEIADRRKAETEAETAKIELEQERASRKQAIQQAIVPLEDRLASLESKRSSLTKERDFLLESKNKDGACIISQNQIIDQLKAQTIEPQVITQEVRVEVEKLVEVVPEDYEQLKKEINVLKKTLEDLKQESCEELSQHQTKVRKLTIELTKKEKLLESSSNEEQKQLKGIQKINEGMKCIEEACSLLGNRCENIFHPQLKEVIESSLQSLILFLNNFFCNDKNRK